MTITQHTRRRVIEAIPAGGAPLRVIAEISGVHISNVRMVAKLLALESLVFLFRTGTAEGGKPEFWAFMDEATRDHFAALRVQQAAERQRQREQARAEARKQARAADPNRNARSIAAERREQERARRKADAEQAAADSKTSLERTQKKLRTLTAAAGLQVFKAGTLSPKPSAWDVAAPSMPAVTDEELAAIEVQELPCRLRQKHQVDEAPPLFRSLKPGQYIAPAPAWLQGVV